NAPELIREVLATKVKSFYKLDRQRRALRKIEGDGLGVAEGAPRGRHPPVVEGGFHAPPFARLAANGVRDPRRRGERRPPGEPLDLATEMNELALETTAKLVLDLDVADQVAMLRDAVHTFRVQMQKEVSSHVVLPDWLPLPGKVHQRRAVGAINQLLWGL